jgi:hypothetical protein
MTCFLNFFITSISLHLYCLCVRNCAVSEAGLLVETHGVSNNRFTHVFKWLNLIWWVQSTYFDLKNVFRNVYFYVRLKMLRCHHYHHHHVREGLGVLSCSLILKVKSVPPSLPRSSYVPWSFWSIL